MEISKDNVLLLNLLRLQSAFGAGSSRVVRIYEILENADFLSKPIDKSLYSLIDKKYADKILDVDADILYGIIDDCLKNDIEIITISDEQYPDRLRSLNDSPIVLFIKGMFPDIDNEPIISIVGPRRISNFGRKAAYSLSKRLAKSGIIIASGGALGADTEAHKGALACNKVTIAVLGCGICCDYLPENRAMREQISKNGCLISEYPPYTKGSKYSFPIRNRIISGISLGTVVVEAGVKSGALITARHANEQGRDVFVIPGNPTFPQYKGSNALLRDGALPLLDASDVFNQYISQYFDKIDLEKAFADDIKNESFEKTEKKLHLGLSKEAEIVYNNLNKQKFTADDLLCMGIDNNVLISALTELEVEQLIRAMPGGNYEIIN